MRDAITAGIAGVIRRRKRIMAMAVARSRGSARELPEGRCVREADWWVRKVGGGPQVGERAGGAELSWSRELGEDRGRMERTKLTDGARLQPATATPRAA